MSIQAAAPLSVTPKHACGESEATMTEGEGIMRPAVVQVEPTELEPFVQSEPAMADDVVHLCGLGSFPASDPPSWWAEAGSG